MAEEVVRTTIRKVRRTTEPQLPFFPWGLVPLVGLVAVLVASAPVAKVAIEAVALDGARDALRAGGHGWVEVSASGQHLTLTGAPPTPSAVTGLEERVLAVTAPTWLGARAPATHVTAEWRAAAAPCPVAPTEAPTGVPASTGGFVFQRAAGSLSLTGDVADAATHAAVVDAVTAAGVTGLVDGLTERGAAPSPAERVAAVRAVDTLAKCDTGRASWKDGTFALTCELGRAAEPAVRAAASAPIDGGTVGEVSLLVAEDVASCEQALTALLAASTIEFATSKADIRPASGALLDAVAAEAAKCPGKLRIEGHTDNVGGAEKNLVLSEQRAAAVREQLVNRGVAGDRLVPVGYGDTRPTAENTTSAGRAKNRRIDIKVVRSQD
ncbi:MAG: OmpA family protein [Myxococcota bacterium]